MVDPVCRSHVLHHYNVYLDPQSARELAQLPVTHASVTCCPPIQQALQLRPMFWGADFILLGY